MTAHVSAILSTAGGGFAREGERKSRSRRERETPATVAPPRRPRRSVCSTEEKREKQILEQKEK